VEVIGEMMKGGIGYHKENLSRILTGFTDELFDAVSDTLGFIKGMAKAYPAMFEFMMGSKTAPKAHELVGQVPLPSDRFEFTKDEGEYSFFVKVLISLLTESCNRPR